MGGKNKPAIHAGQDAFRPRKVERWAGAGRARGPPGKRGKEREGPAARPAPPRHRASGKRMAVRTAGPGGLRRAGRKGKGPAGYGGWAGRQPARPQRPMPQRPAAPIACPRPNRPRSSLRDGPPPAPVHATPWARARPAPSRRSRSRRTGGGCARRSRAGPVGQASPGQCFMEPWAPPWLGSVLAAVFSGRAAALISIVSFLPSLPSTTRVTGTTSPSFTWPLRSINMTW